MSLTLLRVDYRCYLSQTRKYIHNNEILLIIEYNRMQPNYIMINNYDSTRHHNDSI